MGFISAELSYKCPKHLIPTISLPVSANMAATETSSFSVEEIAALSDTALGQFMKVHRRPDGGYDLPVNGWDKLSEDERNRLARRLK